jgi:hypothetical protein
MNSIARSSALLLFVLLSQAACHRPSVDQSLVGTWRRTFTLESDEWFIDYSYFADHTFSATGRPKIMTESFKEDVGEIAPTTGTWRIEGQDVVLQVKSDAGKPTERTMRWKITRVEQRRLIVNDSIETMSLERIK